jgi:hypothetical protein
VNTVMNLRIRYRAGNFLTTEPRLVSEEGVCSMELSLLVKRNTSKLRCKRFRSVQVSVNTFTNIYTIPLYVPLKISNSAADYKTENF